MSETVSLVSWSYREEPAAAGRAEHDWRRGLDGPVSGRGCVVRVAQRLLEVVPESTDDGRPLGVPRTSVILRRQAVGLRPVVSGV